VSASANVAGAEFYESHVTGTMDGDIMLSRCLITNITYIYGYIEQCFLGGGTIVLGGGNQAVLLDCWTGEETHDIDMGGSGQSLSVAGLNGRIRIINKTGPDTVTLFLNSGTVIIDLDTVTAGSFIAEGVGRLIDGDGNHLDTGTYGGVTVVNLLTNPQCIAHLVWDEDEGQFITKSLRNKRALVKVGGTWYLDIYDDDGVTQIMRKPLKDPNGNEITDIPAGVLAIEEASGV